MKTKTFRIGGIHPDDDKLTRDMSTRQAPLPRQAVFPLSQHIGAPAKPVVKRGDKVKVGTLIAEAGAAVSANIHSSVAGKVSKIDNMFDTSGYRRPAIIIDVEGDEWEESIDRTPTLETIDNHPELSPEEIVSRIRQAGIVGMGGAGFPTYVKLCPPPALKAECLIINAVECEPYITADYRLMMEHPDETLVGILLMMRAAKVDKAYIGIEENKPEAIRLMSGKTAGNSSVEVVALRQRYPQGGERQLIDAILRRQVAAPPALPISVGAIVQNIATAFAVYQGVMKRKPLVERVTTVTGKEMEKPGNFRVRIGTPIADLIQECGGLPDGDNKILAGGPMMGKAVSSLDMPVCKTTNGITVISGDHARRNAIRPCIRCGKCVDVCPMGLEPYLIATMSAKKMWESVEREDITSCIECGSCHYTCPSNRPILDNIRVGKAAVMAIIRKRNPRK